MGQVQGKVAIVTGGNSGIGQAIAPLNTLPVTRARAPAREGAASDGINERNEINEVTRGTRR